MLSNRPINVILDGEGRQHSEVSVRKLSEKPDNEFSVTDILSKCNSRIEACDISPAKCKKEIFKNLKHARNCHLNREKVKEHSVFKSNIY